MLELRHRARARASALERYSQSMGRLVKKCLTDAALIAARQEAEREAYHARRAKHEIEQAAAAFAAEMTTRQSAQSRFAFMAGHDPLTALANRTLFNDHLAFVVEEARRLDHGLALFYLNLDNFKHLNDTLDHATGDGLMREVAGRIESHLHRNEDVARIGGDEFALLQRDTKDSAQPADLGNRLLAALSEPFEAREQRIFIGASIGITMFPRDASHLELLDRNADLAIYRAKDGGRSRYQFFDAAPNRGASRRSLIEQALREPALMSQLRLVYQPQTDLRTNRISGVEALLRWNHPEHGEITPDEFIPIAERPGIIEDIGLSVPRDSCLQGVRWRAQGIAKLTGSVNVSTVHFRIGDLSRMVADSLAQTRLPASLLELDEQSTSAVDRRRGQAAGRWTSVSRGGRSRSARSDGRAITQRLRSL